MIEARPSPPLKEEREEGRRESKYRTRREQEMRQQKCCRTEKAVTY
jgi:hypothetical protein